MSNGTSQIVIITGNIGQDHDLKVMTNQKPVLNFSVATSESWKDSKTGELKTETEWHRCVAFDRKAENTAQYTGKGSKVQVIGRLKTRKWTDNEGIVRYITEIMVRDIQFLDRKPSDKDGKDSSENTGSTANNTDIPPATNHEIPEFDDDIPF